MNRFVSLSLPTVPSVILLGALLCVLCITSAQALDGGTLRVTPDNDWEAFEVISQGDDPSGDGFSYSMPGTFDGAGAWLVDSTTLRVQANHETSDASISEVNLDLGNLYVAIVNVIDTGNTEGVSFVISARQAYDRWSSDGGSSFTNTSNASNTSFSRFCSGQAYAPDTFGPDRGFVDQLYITGEEVSDGRLFVLDSVGRDLYQLSGTVGSAPGGIGGMSFDSWENAALIDTGETEHVALLLSPDGGSSSMKLYIGEKGRDASGNADSSVLARNGLAYGSWYYLNASLPSLGNSNPGTFDTSLSGRSLPPSWRMSTRAPVIPPGRSSEFRTPASLPSILPWCSAAGSTPGRPASRSPRSPTRVGAQAAWTILITWTGPPPRPWVEAPIPRD